jgi:hypothetical protein
VTNLPAGTEQSVSLEAGLESAFITRATYAHAIPRFLKDATVYARFTWPFVTPDLKDFAIDAGLSATVIGSERWKVQLLLGPVLRNTSNDVFSATAMGLRSGLLAGYRSDGWGLMTELGYEQILATHLSHTDLYRDTFYAEAKDGWYAITGGTWQLGLRGGGRLGRVELFGAVGVMTTDQLKPLTPPFYATIGSSYAF